MKKMTKNKKVTNEDLAKLITGVSSEVSSLGSKVSSLEKYMKDGFESLDTKIELVQEEIVGVKNQLEGTNKRIDDYAETKTSKIEHEKLITRVDFIERKLEIVK